MVHTFERGGLLLALDTESGAVHLLDRLAFLLLSGNTDQARREFSDREIETADCELSELKNSGQLFTEENVLAREKAKEAKPVLKAMCLHMAHACNMECRYCFAKGGKFGGKWELMPFDVAKKAIDMLCKNSAGRRNLEVDFFGGEPLLNFEVIKQTVAYARELEKTCDKKFRFTLTTNGLMLDDEIIDFINAEMENIVLSHDGRKSVNDANRKTLGGEGSYDLITDKYKKLLSRRGKKSYYVRGTFTADNLDFYRDVFHLADVGFFNISVEPVSSEGTDYALEERHLDKIADSYEKIFNRMLEKDDFSFFHLLTDLSGGPCAIKRIRGCGAGCEYLAVTPTGELYPCHQFVGVKKYRLGTLEEGVCAHEITEEFYNTTLLTKAECKECFAKYFCSGGCAAAGYNATGNIKGQDKMYCELVRMRTEFAIALVARRASDRSEKN